MQIISYSFEILKRFKMSKDIDAESPIVIFFFFFFGWGTICTLTSENLGHTHKLSLADDTEMPTSTFLPYFVRFLKENTAVRFFPPKYVFNFFFFFFFFFILESESSTVHTLFML